MAWSDDEPLSQFIVRWILTTPPSPRRSPAAGSALYARRQKKNSGGNHYQEVTDTNPNAAWIDTSSDEADHRFEEATCRLAPATKRCHGRPRLARCVLLMYVSTVGRMKPWMSDGTANSANIPTRSTADRPAKAITMPMQATASCSARLCAPLAVRVDAATTAVRPTAPGNAEQARRHCAR